MASLTATTDFPGTLPLLRHISQTFGTPREIITDNAAAFSSDAANAHHRANGTTVRPVTPARPRGNGKVEQANGVLKGIINRRRLEQCRDQVALAITMGFYLYNRMKGPSRYSPFYLLYGTQPPDGPDQGALFGTIIASWHSNDELESKSRVGNLIAELHASQKRKKNFV